jgi:hypothetical protein
VLALAIAYLVRTQKFFPAQAELLDAMLFAKRRLHYKFEALYKWLDDFDEKDMLLLHHDQEKWQALYLASPEKIDVTLAASDFVSRYLVQSDNHFVRTTERNAALHELRTKIENQMVCDTIREFIGSNGAISKRDVHQGDPVPAGVALRPIPDDLVKRLPECSSGLKDCKFLTAQHIAIVSSNEVDEIIER